MVSCHCHTFFHCARLVMVGAIAVLTGCGGKNPPAITSSDPPAPALRARIQDVVLIHGDSMQKCELVLHNDGGTPAEVWAIIYARNDKVYPVRAQIWPMWRVWYRLAGKRGEVKPADLERQWLANPFDEPEKNQQWHAQDKAGKVAVPPRGQAIIPVEHQTSAVGYDRYHVWLFTAEGKCFLDTQFDIDLASLGKTLKAEPAPPPREAPPEEAGR